jgi:hypothetical protein
MNESIPPFDERGYLPPGTYETDEMSISVVVSLLIKPNLVISMVVLKGFLLMRVRSIQFLLIPILMLKKRSMEWN